MAWMGFEEFFNNYWYIFVVLALLVFYFLVWKRLDYYMKRKLINAFTMKRVIIVSFLLGWYIWAKRGEMIQMKQANFWMPLILFVGLAVFNYIGKLKYKTRQVLCANYHGSFSPEPIRINGFLIFSVGSFNAGGLSWPKAEEVLILREETGEMFDRGFVSISRVSPVDLYDLDPSVTEEVQRTAWFKEAVKFKKIFFGWFDDINQIDWTPEQLEKFQQEKDKDKLFNLLKTELGIDNPSIKELYRLYKNTNKAYNKQTEVLNSVIDATDKGADHWKRQSEVFGRKPQPEKIEGYEET